MNLKKPIKVSKKLPVSKAVSFTKKKPKNEYMRDDATVKRYRKA